MKHFLLLSAVIFLHATAVAQITFQKTFDLNQDDEFLACIETSDGGFLAGGYSLGVPFGGLVVKTWNDGTVQWSKTVGGTRISDIVETPSGMFYVAGENTVSSNTNFYLLKLDGAGNVLWARTYGKTSEPDALYSMALCPDGGVILSGSADSTNGPGFLPVGYIVKVDSSGNHEWSRYMSGGNGEIFYVTKPLSSGGYLSCGYTGSFGSQVGTEAYVVRWDNNGNVVWTSVFGHNNRFDRIYDFVEKPNGGFWVTGKGLYTSTTDNLFLASLDNAGRVVWHHNYNLFDDVQRLLLLQDGNLAMCGYNINQNLSVYNQSYLIKTDTSGNVLWGRQYGASGLIDDKLWCAYQTTDGGFLLSGSTYGTGVMRTAWLVRTDSTGESGCRDSALNVVRTSLTIASTSGGTVSTAAYNANQAVGQLNANMAQQYLCGGPTATEPLQQESAASIYPQPVIDVVSLVVPPQTFHAYAILNIAGQTVQSGTLLSGLNVVHVAQLPAGTYFIQLRGERACETQPLIKL